MWNGQGFDALTFNHSIVLGKRMAWRLAVRHCSGTAALIINPNDKFTLPFVGLLKEQQAFQVPAGQTTSVRLCRSLAGYQCHELRRTNGDIVNCGRTATLPRTPIQQCWSPSYPVVSAGAVRLDNNDINNWTNIWQHNFHQLSVTLDARKKHTF